MSQSGENSVILKCVPKWTLTFWFSWLLFHPVCVQTLLQVWVVFLTPCLCLLWVSGVKTSKPVFYLLPGVCFIQVISFFYFPHIFYMSPRSFPASLCWKKKSFNSNFHTGSQLKEWCSVPRGIAVRSICHWQDYLRKNICQTHRELGLWILITQFQAMTFWVQRQGILLVNKPLNLVLSIFWSFFFVIRLFFSHIF